MAYAFLERLFSRKTARQIQQEFLRCCKPGCYDGLFKGICNTQFFNDNSWMLKLGSCFKMKIEFSETKEQIATSFIVVSLYITK